MVATRCTIDVGAPASSYSKAIQRPLWSSIRARSDSSPAGWSTKCRTRPVSGPVMVWPSSTLSRANAGRVKA
ncbi:hypothetical protein ACFPN0_25585 [Kitasatospora cinereorecta]